MGAGSLQYWWPAPTHGWLFKKAAELPKDKEVILYCEKGIRSVIAIQRLEAQGFTNLTNLAGGMKTWKASNL